MSGLGAARPALRTGATGIGVAAAIIVVGLLAPHAFTSSFDLELLDLVVVYGVVVLGLNVMVGYLGYLPFSQVAFFGLGGYTGAIVGTRLTTNLWACLGIAIGIAVVVSLIVGRLTLHMRGLYFAIITLALAQMFGLVLTDMSGLTGGTNGIVFSDVLRLPLPGKTVMLADYVTSYRVTLVFAAVIVVALWLLMRSGLGRLAVAVRDNEALARSLGVRTTALKLIAFVVASSVGAVAGVFYFAYFAFVSPDTFNLQASLLLVLMIVLGGKGHFWTPMIGAALFEVVPNEVSISDDVRWLIFGAVMILVVTLIPDGLGGAALRALHRLRRTSGSDLSVPVPAVGRPVAVSDGPATARTSEDVALSVDGVAKRFGGVHALKDVSFDVRAGGEVLGLIGPNGSGKTTVFNVISGFTKPDSGTVKLAGVDIVGLPPERIAGRGLVRTFQEEAAFPTLSVAECQLVARVAGSAGGIASMIGLAIRERAERSPDGRVIVGELSHGAQRLVAITLAFASSPSVILLDEPAAGLGPDEARAIGDMIRMASSNEISVVLIEHHMEMVMEVCDRVVVFSSGQKIASGTPAEVAAHPEVVAAYLGSFGDRAATSTLRKGVSA